MCYSALVKQAARNFSRFSEAFELEIRVQLDMYEDIFSRRLEGEKLYLNKAMERAFTQNPSSPKEKAIAKAILRWHEIQIPELEKELFKQKKRLADAERILEKKITKKAESDQRIANNKIEKIKRDLERHKTQEILSESEERIFPLHYASVLHLDEKRNPVLSPMRYLLRPSGKNEDFDRKFNGCYNARLDNLDNVPWWKAALGKRHGLIIVQKFYENVDPKEYEKKFKIPKGTDVGNSIVLCFEPDSVEFMYIPVIYDLWKAEGSPDLWSFALITDEPEPSVAEAGHDRTPIFLKEDAVADWLKATGKTTKELEPILSRREHPKYSHQIVGAA